MVRSRFCIRITRDAFPQIMVDCLVYDGRGYRLFSAPASLLFWRAGT